MEKEPKGIKKDKKKKRKVDLVVISDVHLGTYGCQAKELIAYMRSIKPAMVVLNGDIIDIWQFSKRYWPKEHMRVVKQIVKWISKGVKVHYITGNHDEMLRKFNGFKMGSFSIQNKLLLDLHGKKTWIFHGDVFDVTMKHSKWLTRLGAHGYDLLILINAMANWVSVKTGRGKFSLSKNIKNSVKSAVKYINNFENVCADIAIENQYDTVICGHIHHPEIRTIERENGSVVYMNSGDWVENKTALEYHHGQWSIYQFSQEDHEVDHDPEETDDEYLLLDNQQLFNLMIKEFSDLKPVQQTHFIKPDLS